ncbi:MAG: hypothetical protein H7146_14755 [Burkholderiaceae bacterium]|nr:hypothetical protein [Microbacteriaceae bacterium]
MSAVRVIPAAGTRRIRAWRIGLLSVGLALLVVGGLVLLADVAPRDYLGILSWMVGAIVLHDGVLALGVFAGNLVLRRAGRIIPWGVIAILQCAIVTGGIVALIVVPEIIKKAIGTTNPTVLPLDYGLNLAVFYAGLALATAVAIVLHLRVTRARRRAASATSAR